MDQNSQNVVWSITQELPGSVPSKAVCREIGPALWKIGSTDFVRMS